MKKNSHMNADVPQIQQNLQSLYLIRQKCLGKQEIRKVCKVAGGYCTYFRKNCTSGRSITEYRNPPSRKKKIAQKKFSTGHSSDPSCHCFMRRWILCIPDRITCWKKLQILISIRNFSIRTHSGQPQGRFRLPVISVL